MGARSRGPALGHTGLVHQRLVGQIGDVSHILITRLEPRHPLAYPARQTPLLPVIVTYDYLAIRFPALIGAVLYGDHFNTTSNVITNTLGLSCQRVPSRVLMEFHRLR